jgi:phenylacetate-coenzyme A ligase PaaK-like adenylate-forming protein
MRTAVLHPRLRWGGSPTFGLRLQRRIAWSFACYLRLSARARWSEARLKKFQEDRVRSALKRARESVPFHRERAPAEAATLSSWPLTTRRDLQSVPVSQLLAQGITSDQCSVLTTSGSTGEPLRVYYSAADMRLRWLYFIRMFRAYGLGFICRLAEVGQYKTSRVYIPGQRWSADQRTFLSVSDSVDARLDLMTHANPEAVIGYTNDLVEMAERSRARELTWPSLRVVIGVGELMDSVRRVAISESLGVEPYDSYGAVEVGNIAFECPARCGTYHIQADHLMIEVLRPDGSAADYGELGEVTVTSLGYQAMPLVRYQLGDLAALGPPCRCGSPFLTLEGLHGRTDDVITLSSGRRLTPQAVIRVFCCSGLRRYRLRQHAPGRFTLEADGDAKAVLGAGRGLREILDPGDHLEVTPTTLPPGRSKERTIVVEAS